MSDWAARLTDEQVAAAMGKTRLTRSITVVTAGPGAGKTRVIAARIGWLLQECSVRPDDIRVFVFSRSAAEEIRTRVARSFGLAMASRVDVTTFHAYAARLLPPGLNVATAIEAAVVEQSLFDGPMRVPKRDVSGRRDLRRAVIEHEAGGSGARLSQTCAHAIALMRQRLRDAGLVALWDLVPRLLQTPQDDWVEPVEHVLVDEAQDVTPAEGTLAWALGRQLFVVGDPRQAIMGWRGAAPWRSTFAFEPPALFGLTRTFRFGHAIADVANRIQARLGRAEAPLAPNPAVASDVVRLTDEWLDNVAPVAGESMAILCRTNVDCDRYASVLGDRAIRVARDPLDVLAVEADRFDEIARAGKIAISTIHSAKGREWDHVIIAPHETFPSEHEGEEVRVLYVAATRARKTLRIGELSPYGEEILR